jgi:hypothetical protein
MEKCGKKGLVVVWQNGICRRTPNTSNSWTHPIHFISLWSSTLCCMMLLERWFSTQAPRKNGEMGQKRVVVGQYGKDCQTWAIHELTFSPGWTISVKPFPPRQPPYSLHFLIKKHSVLHDALGGGLSLL